MTTEIEKNLSENPENPEIQTEEKEEKPKVRLGVGHLQNGGSQFGGGRGGSNYQNPNIRSTMRRASGRKR